MALHPDSPPFTRALSQGLTAWILRNSLFGDWLPGNDIHISADFGQDDPNVPYQAYSFLVVPAKELQTWKARIEDFRNTVYRGEGRFEFKKLDAERLRHFTEFLECCGFMQGFTVTLLVPKAVRWVFFWEGSKSRVPNELLRKEFSISAKPHIAEKIMRIAHAVTGILASLPAVGEWVSLHVDRDAATQKLQEFVQLVQRLLAGNIGGNLRHLAVIRDEGSKGLDADLLAIPDLVCGAITEIHNRATGTPHKPSEKSALICSWITSSDRPLKHLVLRYDLMDIEGEEHARWVEITYQPSDDASGS